MAKQTNNHSNQQPMVNANTHPHSAFGYMLISSWLFAFEPLDYFMSIWLHLLGISDSCLSLLSFNYFLSRTTAHPCPSRRPYHNRISSKRYNPPLSIPWHYHTELPHLGSSANSWLLCTTCSCPHPCRPLGTFLQSKIDPTPAIKYCH